MLITEYKAEVTNWLSTSISYLVLVNFLLRKERDNLGITNYI